MISLTKFKKKTRRYNRQTQFAFSSKIKPFSNSFLKFKNRLIIRRPLTKLFRKVSLYYSLKKLRPKLDIFKYKKLRKERLFSRSRKLKRRKFYFLQRVFRGMKKSNLIVFKRLQKHFLKSSHDPLLSKDWFDFFKRGNLVDNNANSPIIKFKKFKTKYRKRKPKEFKKVKKSKLFKSLFFSLFFNQVQSGIDLVNNSSHSLNLEQKKTPSIKNQKRKKRKIKMEKKKKLKRKKI